MSITINNQFYKWNELSKQAWNVRKNAAIFGETKVGAAVLSNKKNFVGCNVEQIFRNKDIHAEVNAISTMIAEGENKIEAILVVAERKKFTPCGTCMDWIMQFGGEECVVGFQNQKKGKIFMKKAKELMPYYPN